MATRKNDYTEASIRVLKGLEPVRQRPGMYTRTDNPLHIVQEVIDNAADEALGGHAKHIAVMLLADGGIAIEDDGRGIPVGLHPDEGVPTVEIVFTRLHAGGKFDKQAGGAYSFSGGLHGVGVSVTNALSTTLKVTVWRPDERGQGVHTIVFGGGEVVQPLASRMADKGERRSGTRVEVWPDPKYFDSQVLPMADLERLLRSKAVLLPGVKVTMTAEKTGRSASGSTPRGCSATCPRRWPRRARARRRARAARWCRSSRASSTPMPVTTPSPRARARSGSSAGPSPARWFASRT